MSTDTPAVVDGSIPLALNWTLASPLASATGAATGGGGTASSCVYESQPMDLDVDVWQLWATGMAPPTSGIPTYATFDGFAALTPASYSNHRAHMRPAVAAHGTAQGAVVRLPMRRVCSQGSARLGLL